VGSPACPCAYSSTRRACPRARCLTPGITSAAAAATRQMFERAKSQAKKASQWRNPNNLRFEALRCVVALQATKPSVAAPFREDVVACLRSPDASLRHLAADVLYNSCTSDNLSGVAEQVRYAHSFASREGVTHRHDGGRATPLGASRLHASRPAQFIKTHRRALCSSCTSSGTQSRTTSRRTSRSRSSASSTPTPRLRSTRRPRRRCSRPPDLPRPRRGASQLSLCSLRFIRLLRIICPRSVARASDVSFALCSLCRISRSLARDERP
jgi:hypothetical protein